MNLSSLINKCLSYLGVRLSRLPKYPEVNAGNTYSLDPISTDGMSLDTRKVLNLISYTKTRKNTYNAESFTGGYLNLSIDGREFKGQRDPMKRLADIPFNFNGASVLDLGCNQGGMLRAISDRIEWGVGLDYNYKLVNAANKIRAYNRINNINYYVFDFVHEKLEILPNFYPGSRVDIVFLLSVCAWIKNWTAVIDAARAVSGSLLFESNGPAEAQCAQEEYLRSSYANVTLVRNASTDDSIYQKRRLFLCRESENVDSNAHGVDGRIRDHTATLPVLAAQQSG